MTPVTLREAAALIESLTAERDALAETARVMREAVKSACEFIEATHNQLDGSLFKAQAMGICAQLSETYHADAIEAEQRAKENAEKAALLDWATARMETHNEYVFPAFGPTSQDPDCRFAWFRYDRNGLAHETAYEALRAAKEASDAGE